MGKKKKARKYTKMLLKAREELIKLGYDIYISVSLNDMIETDEHGLYVNADNYRECLFRIVDAKIRREEWESIPKWKRIFIDKERWNWRQVGRG